MKTALVIAHPGHELRLLGWVSRTRPLVSVLTDGSGSAAQPRVYRSRQILSELGCRFAESPGQLSDRDIYQKVLEGDLGFFWSMVVHLSDQLKAHQIEVVVSDMREGYSPTHDLIEAVTRAAVAQCSQAAGRAVEHWTFPLTGMPDTCPEERERVLSLELTDEEFEAKIARAREYEELAAELAELEKAGSLGVFKKELLFSAAGDMLQDEFLENPPYYETYGRRQVEKGLYSFVLTYPDHIRPILRHLEERLQS